MKIKDLLQVGNDVDGLQIYSKGMILQSVYDTLTDIPKIFLDKEIAYMEVTYDCDRCYYAIELTPEPKILSRDAITLVPHNYVIEVIREKGGFECTTDEIINNQDMRDIGIEQITFKHDTKKVIWIMEY